MKKPAILLSLAAVLAAGALYFGSFSANAASMTLNPGDDVWTAVNQLASGDTLTFNAGTYSLNNYIDIAGKSNISLIGVGDVILEYDGAGGPGVPGIKQAIQIYNSQNISVSNLTVNAIDNVDEQEWATASTGVGINSSCDVKLSNLTLSGFGKSAVTVTAYQDGTETCSSKDITLDNITMVGDDFGLMFTNGNAAPATDITGVVFSGTNTISNVNMGILTDASYSNKVTGADNGKLDLGVVNITTKDGQNALTMNAATPVSVNENSVVNGQSIKEMSEADATAILGANVEIVQNTPLAPAVPDTGFAPLEDSSNEANNMLSFTSAIAILVGATILMSKHAVVKNHRKR